MPRITKAYRASVIIERLEIGPSLSFTFAMLDGLELSAEQKKAAEKIASDAYALWVRSWVLPELRELLPK